MKHPPTPLRLARHLRGLTIRELHAETGVATGRISMLERGMLRPHDAELQRLSAALGVRVEELYPPERMQVRG